MNSLSQTLGLEAGTSTTITDNRIYDGAADPADGINAASTSFGIDTPNGGVVTISGNLIVQGPTSQNSKMVAYGEEGLKYANNSLSVTNNTRFFRLSTQAE